MDTQNIDFWEKKYQNNETGWDLGTISTPLKEYIDQLNNKDLKILIPGAGNAHEAEYLYNHGFKNVVIVDWAESALKNVKNRIPDFPSSNLIATDFFKHQEQYDLILEQTFFCAINKNLREKYVYKVSELLKPNGKLVGLLFNIPLQDDKPPFGGSKKEYIGLFHAHFKLKTMEIANNSIEPRKNNELFIILEKK